MRRTIVAALAISAALFVAQPAGAGTMSYLALGDSVAYGETDFTQNPSNGDRGYVSPYANFLGGQNGGVRPSVVNYAIDGETSSSFLTGTNRVISSPGMTDQKLASWNTNYTNPATTQNQMMQQQLIAANAAGNPVSVVTLSLGANDLFKLAANPTFQSATPAVQQQMLTATLNQIGSSYSIVLAEIHALDPTAKVYAMGEYNPFPANPTNPLNAIAKPAVQGLNATIQSVAGTWGATYVDTYTPFLGHEAQYTYMTVTPGNVHPNAEGYAVIANQLINATPAPEPSTIAVLGLGFAAIAVTARRRSLRNRAA